MRRAEVTALAAVAAGVAAVAGLAMGLTSYWLFLATSAVLNALIALSVGVVHGRAGMVTLCPMAFAGIGAWTAGWLNVHAGLPFLAMIVVGGLAAVPVGVLIGLPALRLRGVNLAVATLAFGGAVSVVIFDKGFPGASERSPVGRPVFADSESGFFVLSVAVLALVGAALAWAGRRSVGARWTAVRDSERATAALGYSVPATKLLAFAVSAFIAGLGGALMAGQLGTLSGIAFQPMASMVAFTAAVAFGAAYLEGAVLAGVAATFVPELLRRVDLPQDIAPALFAVAALQALAAGSDGVAGQLRAALRGRRRAAAHAAAGAPPGAEHASSGTTSPGPASPGAGPPPALGGQGGRPSRPAARGEAGDPVLRTVGVTVRHGAVTALDRVDLAILDGTVHGLIGPNGAGKSTLIDVLSGFLVPAEGRVLLGETELDGVPVHERARRGVRRSFQQGRVNPELTVGQYLALSGRGIGDRDLVEELIEVFGCPPAGTRVASVDVGTRRLVEVAATLAAGPRVVLLDEPAAGLSAAESFRLGLGIAAVPERFGCAVLLVEHDIELVATCCDRATALDAGRVIARGTPAEVLADPAVARAYLGADPDRDAGQGPGSSELALEVNP